MSYRYRYFGEASRRPLCDVVIEDLLINRDAELAAMRSGLIATAVRRQAARSTATRKVKPTEDKLFAEKLARLSPKQLKQLMDLMKGGV